MEEVINNRIKMLDMAEQLAMQDEDPKNANENIEMVFRCMAGKEELMNLKELLFN